jgi:hypothetical protein
MFQALPEEAAMTIHIDHRDFLTYSEGRELASRERAEAIRAVWAGIAAWVSRYITTAPAPSAQDLGREASTVLETHPWARGELDQQFYHRGRLQAGTRT